jgi:hypothetical protein
VSLSADLPTKQITSLSDRLCCPYCEAPLSGGVISCRHCGRDLTPILPLLHRLAAAESRLTRLEAHLENAQLALPAPDQTFPDATAIAQPAAPPEKRRLWPIPLGLAALLAAHWTVVIWLDLPLAALRLTSIVVPFAVGLAYFGIRPRLKWFDVLTSLLFAAVAVSAMNAVLGWIDTMPMYPQGAAAWQETLFYMLSISASMLSGMLLRVTQAALAVRGLTSLPRLREGLLGTNGKAPVETLKAIELTILLISTAFSAITGLLAGFLGLTQ